LGDRNPSALHPGGKRGQEGKKKHKGEFEVAATGRRRPGVKKNLLAGMVTNAGTYFANGDQNGG